MLSIKTVLSSAVLVIGAALNAHATTFATINADFLWDAQQPHEGRLIGQKKPAPTAAEYEKELNFYAEFIVKHNVDVASFSEIEHCTVLKDLAKRMDGRWNVACKKGRDSYTGQDVGILTRFSVDRKSLNNHKDSVVYGNDKKVRPSKALSVVLRDGDETYLVTSAHLISKRGDNDLKRQMQAQAIVNTASELTDKYQPNHQIFMGDFNDTPHSKTLDTFYQAGVVNNAKKNHCSYVYRKKCTLIDHILVSQSLASGSIETISIPSKYSDHKIVLYRSK